MPAGNDARGAADRLLARADWLERRAGTGNGRRKCDARAMHLKACAALILSTTQEGERVRQRLEEAGAWTLGWRSLAEWVTLIAGELRAGAKRG